MLLQTVFNGTLLFILNLVILNTNAQLLKNYQQNNLATVYNQQRQCTSPVVSIWQSMLR